MKNLRASREIIFVYLRSKDPISNRTFIITSTIILFFWLSAIIFFSVHHVFWRDEVRSLSIALGVDSFFDLPRALKNEGHPVLWYLLLRAGYSVIGSSLILPALSIGIALAAVIIYYLRAPFSNWQKLIFIFSALPFYEYSVMARNYGISMLLLFLFATLYQKRDKYPLLLGVILATLANTNVHSTMLAGILTAIWLWDNIADKQRSQACATAKPRMLVPGGAFALIALGGLAAIIVAMPDGDAISTQVFSLGPRKILRAIFDHLTDPGGSFEEILPPLPPQLPSLLLWLLVAGLLIDRPMLVALLLATLLLGAFFNTVYFGAFRHQGILLIYAISLYWIARNRTDLAKTGDFSRRAHQVAVYGVLPLVFSWNVIKSGPLIYRDLYLEQSSSRSFSRFLQERQDLRDAIILGEPDYYIESLPYYARNVIYIPRESRFGKTVSWSKTAKENLSLHQLLAIGKALHEQEKKPVLIALGYFDLDHNSSFQRHYPYNKTFTWSPEQMNEFHASTNLIARFRSAGDESYDVYYVR